MAASSVTTSVTASVTGEGGAGTRGDSGGMAHVGSSDGSLLASRDVAMRVLRRVGAGAGLGAFFAAPLGGMVSGACLFCSNWLELDRAWML